MSDPLLASLAFLAGALLASLVWWLLTRSRAQVTALTVRAEADKELAALKERLAGQQAAVAEKVALLKEAQDRLSEHFRSAASEALESNNKVFIDLAKSTLERFQQAAQGDLEKRQEGIRSLVEPVQKTLERFESRMGEVDKARAEQFSALGQHVESLITLQNELRDKTTDLVRALKSSSATGRWGEVQLRRVVELAGMVDHCDFFEQKTGQGEDGALRPDMLVRLPGGRTIVVDAKAPVSAYMEAAQASDDGQRRQLLARHAQLVKEHAVKLGRKSYWEQFKPGPEFVVMFLPGENFFSAALEADPQLLEAAVGERVVLATPTTLIALLKAVSYGWRQERMADNARAVAELGQVLYKRLADLAGHLADTGRWLDKAVESFNKTVASFESRALVSARKFRELDAAGGEKEIAPLEPVDRAARKPETPA
ncbi:MAG: DNA recombination protein RmuC [Elusimicrobia bacterium]|nr:DNA recombination protein RmuC [Elusimicrobiota bacterium]